MAYNTPTAPQVDPRKLFVGNLSWNLSGDDLAQEFGAFGQVVEAIVVSDRMTGRSKGFGFVTMSTPEEAQAAIEGLNNKELDGRAIAVNVAQPPRPREQRPGGFGGGNRFQSRDRRDDRRGGYRQAA